MVGHSRSLRSQILVFAAAALYLGWGVGSLPLASGYTDPVRKVRPQDEAHYSSISIGMAERGEWLTPRFLGRLALVKPIGAFLPTALSVRLFGDNLWSLRLFAVLCGAGAIAALYRWQGLSAAFLLAANPLFFFLSRRNMTDVPVLCATLLALYWWNRSEGRAAAALAWSVLTKSVAGLAPALILYKHWPRIVLMAAALIAPWHIYQAIQNPVWYWNEHILDEHLQWGLNTPENAAAESHAIFYSTRAWAWDPLLATLAPLALLFCLYRKRYTEAAWLAVSVAVLFAFGYRNATYLLPVFAATAAAAGPHIHWALAAGVLALRLATAGISHAPQDPVPPAAALAAYKALDRHNCLMVDGVLDEFVATTMHFARVQYLLPGDARTLAPTNIDFPGRGIVVDARTYRRVSLEPEETVLLLHDASDLRHLIGNAPCDFLLPAHRRGQLTFPGPEVLVQTDGWIVIAPQPFDSGIEYFGTQTAK